MIIFFSGSCVNRRTILIVHLSKSDQINYYSLHHLQLHKANKLNYLIKLVNEAEPLVSQDEGTGL